jgi:two-component system response regulator AtoC
MSVGTQGVANAGRAVLIVEDEPVLARNMALFLRKHGFVAIAVESGEAALEQMATFRPDLVLMDFNLPGMDGLATMRALASREPGLRFILVTGHDSVSTAVEAMKSGASDYLVKPISLEELRLVVERVIEAGRVANTLSYYHRRDSNGIDALVGKSPALVALKEQLQRIIAAERTLHANASAGPPPSILITGETGTGKELAARALHYEGPRAAEPFVEINCAAMPASLIESELFGYERGAFTDAKQRKIGLVEAAHGGTLFLDEVGDIESTTQVKLLKLLEERRVRRLGNVRDIAVDVAIIAATNQPLEQMVQRGVFRADLFFRLCTVSIRLPPLRERGSDVLELAERFLRAEGHRYGKPHITLSDEARRLLVGHTWPGNVRELRNVIEQAVLLAKNQSIEADDLPACRDSAPPAAVQRGETDDETALGAQNVLSDMERSLLLRALQETGGNVTRAADRLNITRDTMRYRMSKYGLTPERAVKNEG